ncbi:uncharacterized protein N7469_004109 [Penicillium citrinum]|uniref:40S ribosomal protein S21 n=1 Tax=Penicillium citrinum TaxID=5077 RepID=A0A9W9P460_PENCI|nr:uncharacterized protein N7469_004109 [Penicillium citrinum]KAJ5234941.1 hypothetical protein N7469_004109 [Penicillium citrinum]
MGLGMPTHTAFPPRQPSTNDHMTHTNHLSPDLCGPKKPSTSNLTVARQIPLHHTRQNGEREGRDRRSLRPRKCSATNRIIKANDHASVQLSVGKVDENGRYTGENETYALCGFIRARGESDDSFNRLAQKDGYLKNVWSASRQR